MNAISIEIHYIASSQLMQRGSFLLRGRRPEQIALAFWKQIQREMSYHARLEKIIVDGDKDFTKLVTDLKKQELRNIDTNWNLPF
ncbi:hypothetical protein [Neobacillus cucumis]|uniref:hypothetical protein n=1 Tax=Neobacillus cucumis TaxID=1740721 RepID=UPI0028534EB5|nr:hypothetical protein [Neobacillus cucumis]MDR4950405.1 hypothetical protein [Neobacillus cucumis]